MPLKRIDEGYVPDLSSRMFFWKMMEQMEEKLRIQEYLLLMVY